MHYETSVEIDAPQEVIWAVLVNAELWPQWTASMTHIESLDGASWAIGTRFRIKQPGIPTSTWEITELESGKSFTWQSLGVGITTVARHQLAVTPGKRVAVGLSIDQSGVLAGIIGLLTSGMIRRNVQMEAQGLKRRCEAA